MNKAEKYLKENSFTNIAIRNKAGTQAYMLSEILYDYTEQEIRELEERNRKLDADSFYHAKRLLDLSDARKEIKELKLSNKSLRRLAEIDNNEIKKLKK